MTATAHHDDSGTRADRPRTPVPLDTSTYIDDLLGRALAAGASDLHIEPLPNAVDVRFRVDGLLRSIEQLSPEAGRGAVLRLMVLAQLLTYRIDIPQEGRVRTTVGQSPLDLRLAVMPVAHGLRAVVRLPAELTQPKGLGELGLPPACVAALQRFSAGTGSAEGGMLLVTGPAGSGKTTTIYALLAHIAETNPGLSIVSLEDPIERHVAGVTQIEVTPHGQLTYDRALKSILRQDPQVLMLGEIRDAATASVAIQAALTGHRLIATLHAGDPATAVARLIEMGIEPYQLTSSLFGVLTQRLVRRLAVPTSSTPHTPPTGYKGRVPLAEFATLSAKARAVILAKGDADDLRTIFQALPGYVTLRGAADALIQQNVTDAAEIVRVLGP